MTKRVLFICLILMLVGCGKSTTPTAQTVSSLSIPTGCIYQSTGAFYFETYYNTYNADKYDCPIYANLTCTFLKSATDHIQEMTCETSNLASPETIPLACVYQFSGGTRTWLDGTTSGGTTAYNCGALHGGMTCNFYDHASGRGDLICVDY
jgi:hypothetical protein